MTLPAAREVLQEYLNNRRFYPDADQIGRLFDEAFRKFYYNKRADAFEPCTPESDRAFWAGLYFFILERLGAAEHATEEELHAWCHDLYDLFTSPEHYSLFDDVKETLAKLSSRGLRLGIVSNFAPTLKTILAAKGILSYFDPVIVSTEVGLEKPDPAIFRLALERAGLAAEDVLYVGDHDTNDIWAPNQVGIDAVKIKRYDFHTGQGIHSLKELLQP